MAGGSPKEVGSFAVFLFQLSLVDEKMRLTSQETIYELQKMARLRKYPKEMMPYLKTLVLPDWKTGPLPMQYAAGDRCDVWKQLAHVPLPMPIRKHWVDARRTEIDYYFNFVSYFTRPDSGISCDLVEFCR
jgi:hypothetical protein